MPGPQVKPQPALLTAAPPPQRSAASGARSGAGWIVAAPTDRDWAPSLAHELRSEPLGEFTLEAAQSEQARAGAQEPSEGNSQASDPGLSCLWWDREGPISRPCAGPVLTKEGLVQRPGPTRGRGHGARTPKPGRGGARVEEGWAGEASWRQDPAGPGKAGAGQEPGQRRAANWPGQSRKGPNGDAVGPSGGVGRGGAHGSAGSVVVAEPRLAASRAEAGAERHGLVVRRARHDHGAGVTGHKLKSLFIPLSLRGSVCGAGRGEGVL